MSSKEIRVQIALEMIKSLYHSFFVFASIDRNIYSFVFVQQLHHSYHRHSVSNLITITPAKTTVTITPTAPISQHQKTSSCMGLHLSSQSTPHSSISSNGSGKTVTPVTSSSMLPPMNYGKHLLARQSNVTFKQCLKFPIGTFCKEYNNPNFNRLIFISFTFQRSVVFIRNDSG